MGVLNCFRLWVSLTVLVSVAYSDGATAQTVNYTSYDNNGNLQALSEGSQTITRSYDSRNRVSSYTDVNGETIGYRYYASGKIAKIIYPGGTESGIGHVEYRYWKTGRLKEVVDRLDSTTNPRITRFYWNPDGRLARIVRPNDTERRIRYDGAGRPEIVEEVSSDGQLIAFYRNRYHPSSDLEWVYQLPQPQTASAVPAPVNAMSYDADNRLIEFEGQSVNHDPDGNMTFGPLPDGTFGVHDYDSRNRLLGAGGLTYGYDPEGERIGITGADESTSFVNENNLGLSKILQRTKNGETTRYVWGVGLLYEVDANGETTTYHYDNVGSTIALTNEAAEVVERVEYAPYGTRTYRQRTAGHEGDLHDTPFLWTGFFGNQTDANELIYLRNRYYNPLSRRFVNSDPAREGWNWNAYAGGNPMTFVDPTGLGLSSAIDSTHTGLSYLGLRSMGDSLGEQLRNDLANHGYDRSAPIGNIGDHPSMSMLTELIAPAGPIVSAFRWAGRAARVDRLIKPVVNVSSRAARNTETVQRAMSRAELEAIQSSGVLSRGGRAGPHYVSDAVNSTANRARQRLALPGSPEVRATLEVPSGTFSPPSTVQPYRIPGTNQVLPGGGLERTAPGNIDIPARIIDVLDYTK